MLFYYISMIIANCMLAMSFLFGLAKRSHFQQLEKWYLAYLGYMCCIELIVKLMIFALDVRNTAMVYPFYISGEFFLLSGLFITVLKSSGKWFFLTGITTVIIFFKTLSSIILHPGIINNQYKIFSHLCIICLAGYSLVKALKHFEKDNSFLPVYACLFLYYSISLFFFLLLNQLPTLSNLYAYIIWGTNNIISAILYGTSIYTFSSSKRSL